MSTSVSWPVIGGTTYSVPAAGEVNWATLSDYLVALAGAQSVVSQKVATRTAVTTPVTVAAATDCIVITNLTVPGAVAVNLPAGVDGQWFSIVDGKGDAATNNITITPNGAETINGAATYVISADSAAIVIAYDSATTNWTVIAEFASATAGGIPRANIAPATPNYVVINNGTGFLSEEQYLAKSRGGTAADNSSVTFPSTGTIITRDSTDTGSGRLQNKDLDDDSVKFVDSADTTKTVEVEASGSATGTTTTLASSSTSNRVVTIPDATTTLVGRDTTDTGANRLQNKDLDASSTKFVDPSDTTKTVAVSASGATTGADLVLASVATVDRTLTLPDATDTLIGRVTTDTGANRLQNKELDDATVAFVDDGDTTKKMKFQVSGVTTATTRTLTVPDANTTIVGTDATQVLTNKDVDGGVAANTRRITVPSDTLANLTALTRKEATIVYATDTDLLYSDDGSVLTPVGSGTASIKANIRASEGAGTTTLTSGDLKIQRFNLSAGRTVVLPATGVVAGDVWQMVNPNPYTLTIEADDNTTILTSWGDDVTLVALVSAPATNTDWAVIGKNVLYGRVWTAYTPSFNGLGTVSTQVFSWMRNNASLLVKGTFTVNATSGASAAEVGLPQPGAGLNIDTTNLVNNSSSFGDWHQLSNGASAVFAAAIGGVCMYSGGAGTQFVRLAYQSSSNTYTTDVSNGFLNANFPVDIGVLTIPIAEWAET